MGKSSLTEQFSTSEYLGTFGPSIGEWVGRLACIVFDCIVLYRALVGSSLSSSFVQCSSSTFLRLLTLLVHAGLFWFGCGRVVLTGWVGLNVWGLGCGWCVC